MHRPLIGITSFSMETPSNLPGAAPSPRSAVNQQYVDAIVSAGGSPICLPVGLDGDSLHHIYHLLDGLLLPGGVDVAPQRYGHEPHPQLGLVDELRDALELPLTEWALRDDLPVLGICRGIQVLAVAGGGTLYQDLPSQREGVSAHEVREFGFDYLCHEVTIEPTSLLAKVLGTTMCSVNSFHHQAVFDVPQGFVVTATSPDGVVEGMEAPDHRFVVGVQCHPEGMWQSSAPHFAGLFDAFVRAALERSASRAA